MSRSPVAFGQYVITRRIARGGMAEIYRAKRRSAGELGKGQWVALKMMRPSLEHEELREQLFKREAKIASAIAHPNVIPLFEFGRELDRYYIAMEYLRGRDLSHLIRGEDPSRGEPMPIELGLYVGLKAAAGLGYAHRLVDPLTNEDLKIVHRDISPGNVMIGYDGSVKVLDFGVARMSESQGLRTQTGTLRGKFAYMSPEQTVGAQIDARSDVFSLGTLLYELLTGANPFRARTPIATLERVQRVRPVPPSRANRKIEREIDELLARCLAKDPRRRFKDARELHDTLGDYLERRGLLEQERLVRFMAERFAWEKQEEEKELKEEEEEVALIEVVDFAMSGDDKGLDAKHVAVSLEEEAEKSAVQAPAHLSGEFSSSQAADEEEAFGVFDLESKDETLAHPSRMVRAISRSESPREELAPLTEPDPGPDFAGDEAPPTTQPGEPLFVDGEEATVAQPPLSSRQASPQARAVEASSLLAPAAATLPTSESDPMLDLLRGRSSSVVIDRAQPARSAPRWSKMTIVTVAVSVASLCFLAVIFTILLSEESAVPLTLQPQGQAATPTKIAPIEIRLDGPKESKRDRERDRDREARAEVRKERPPEPPAPPPKKPDPAAEPSPRELTAPAGPQERHRAAPEPKRQDPPPQPQQEDDDKDPKRDRSGAKKAIKKTGPTGLLNVGARPWAEIEIDGKAWPYQTPQAGIELSVGRHTVKLHNRETGVTKTQVVHIKAGAATTVNKDMSKDSRD
jgi:serine/threonine protein kinase